MQIINDAVELIESAEDNFNIQNEKNSETQTNKIEGNAFKNFNKKTLSNFGIF